MAWPGNRRDIDSVQGSPVGTHVVLLRLKSQRVMTVPTCVVMQTASPRR